MTILDYLLISILYFWASSTAMSLGIGYYTLYRPVIAGLLTGLILKSPFLGMTAGAVVNLIYMNFVSTGGSFKGDQCLTAVMAAYAAIILRLTPVEASAVAYPFGFLGILIWKYRLNINSIFVKKYEKEYERGSNPDISLYDGLFPQLLLYIMSSAVIVAAFLIMNLFDDFILKYYQHIDIFLNIIGLFLVFTSIWNILINLKNKYAIFIFVGFFLVVLITGLSSEWFLIIIAIIIFSLSNKNIYSINKSSDNNNNIKKADLIYSWFIWMNYSHSCYSFERLQGMAFAHSMKNIFKKLYKDKNDAVDAVHRHSEFFNTEPNMGTPILGCIISMEEQSVQGKTNGLDAAYIKKGMMGIAAGLGDSFTQVVLTPLFISLSVMMCLDHRYLLALLPASFLAASILFISFSGWMNGYYVGRDSLIERINTVKNSKVKLYFPYIFSGILGVAAAKLMILDYAASANNTLLTALVVTVTIIIVQYKSKRS